MKKLTLFILCSTFTVAAFSQFTVLPGNDIYYSAGKVAVGHNAPVYAFDVRNVAGGTGSRPAAYLYGEQNAALSGNISGAWSISRASHASGNVTLAIGMAGTTYHSGAGTITGMRGVQANVVVESTGGATSASVFSGAFAALGTGTITTGYGLYLDHYPGNITNKWGVYVADGNAKNYMGGSLGVGMTPVYPLDINGVIRGHSLIATSQSAGITGHFIGAAGNNSNVVIQGGGGTYRAYWITATNDVLKIGAHGGTEPATGALNINHLGQIGIGTIQTGSFKLAVEGKVAAREVKVTLENPWPDYVFASNRHLMPIDELEKYIQANRHLPNIPSAAKVKENGGIELGDMTTRLVEKIEELTLYVIELKKENEAMKKQMEKINPVRN